MRRILIIDGDRHCRTELQQLLQPRGFQVVAADTGESALQQLRAGEFELVLAELQLPDLDGFELLQAVQRLHPDLDVILMAAFGSVEDAVQAMRNGAADFISKPFAAEQVLVAIDRVLEKTTLVRENHDLRVALDDRVRLQNLIGTDGRMQAICKTVRAVADTRTTVLLTGESGTGKTLLARAIHALSSRHNGPFVEVNCGALPESLLESELFGHVKGAFTGAIKDRPGKFEAAQGGTIFLDEVGTSSPAFQIKLLRVVQDRLIERVGDGTAIPVDIRILLATNLDLEQAVSSGAFRADLYYRINVVAIEMPALRSRPNDIPLLAEHFLRRFAGEHRKSIRGFTQAALAALVRWHWPGNVRQLENVVERAVVLSSGDSIDLADLPPSLLASLPAPPTEPLAAAASAAVQPLKQALAGPEKALIEHALRHCGGNREQTARVLGVNRSTLFHKMRKYGIH